ncbi:hypothetical protein MFRU_018g01220 [Monilinia fructicola]|uniref:Transmembrane protein n=1 Tax=Monilinia fructicola TaxID=38448 RepID=A0A5M9JRI5_MONFR|nr:hypothetical protein EYC84_002039 [Monilinia fructicola]KAG4029017.1 hypothetical protein MFRU_018g01220 [Monilinia fructicola]
MSKTTSDLSAMTTLSSPDSTRTETATSFPRNLFLRQTPYIWALVIAVVLVTLFTMLEGICKAEFEELMKERQEEDHEATKMKEAEMREVRLMEIKEMEREVDAADAKLARIFAQNKSKGDGGGKRCAEVNVAIESIDSLTATLERHLRRMRGDEDEDEDAKVGGDIRGNFQGGVSRGVTEEAMRKIRLQMRRELREEIEEDVRREVREEVRHEDMRQMWGEMRREIRGEVKEAFEEMMKEAEEKSTRM